MLGNRDLVPSDWFELEKLKSKRTPADNTGMEATTMSNWQVTIILADDTRETIVAYPSDLSPAQVRAYMRKRVRRTHGRKFRDLIVLYAGPSSMPLTRGMV